jgi:hypothetical protein
MLTLRATPPPLLLIADLFLRLTNVGHVAGTETDTASWNGHVAGTETDIASWSGHVAGMETDTVSWRY